MVHGCYGLPGVEQTQPDLTLQRVGRQPCSILWQTFVLYIHNRNKTIKYKNMACDESRSLNTWPLKSTTFLQPSDSGDTTSVVGDSSHSQGNA